MIRKADGNYQVTAAMLKKSLRIKACDRVILDALHSRGLYLRPMREKPVLTDEDVKQRKAGRPLCIAGEAEIQIIWRPASSDCLIACISLELEQDGRPQGVCQHVHEKTGDVLEPRMCILRST